MLNYSKVRRIFALHSEGHHLLMKSVVISVVTPMSAELMGRIEFVRSGRSGVTSLDAFGIAKCWGNKSETNPISIRQL